MNDDVYLTIIAERAWLMTSGQDVHWDRINLGGFDRAQVKAVADEIFNWLEEAGAKLNENRDGTLIGREVATRGRRVEIAIRILTRLSEA